MGPLLTGATDSPFASSEAIQGFEMADWSGFTEEVGFPATHVHPKASISGDFVWTYAGDPDEDQGFPGIRLDAHVSGDVGVSVQGNVGSGSAVGNSSTTAQATLKVWHPCPCVQLMLVDRDVTIGGDCQLGGTYTSKASFSVGAQQGGKKKKEGEEAKDDPAPAVNGAQLSAGYVCELTDLSYLESMHFMDGGPLAAQTSDSIIKVSFATFASITQNGATDNAFLATGYASGQGTATAAVHISGTAWACGAVPRPFGSTTGPTPLGSLPPSGSPMVP